MSRYHKVHGRRYSVHTIMDASCSSYMPEPLTSLVTLKGAKDAAARIAWRHVYGVCVLDRETGLVDYGAGLGKPAVFPRLDDEPTEVIPNMDALVREAHAASDSSPGE